MKNKTTFNPAIIVIMVITMMLSIGCGKDPIVIDTTTKPTVSTQNANDVSVSGANLNGSVTNDGELSITDKGFYLSTTNPPAATDTKISKGPGNTVYDHAFTSGNSNTTYYYCAYAVNGKGTNTGAVMNFTTLKAVELGISEYDLGATIMNISYFVIPNNTIVAEAGICYIAGNNTPTINDNKEIGSSTGGTISLSGLTKNSVYSICIYADTDRGVKYSNPIVLQTYEGIDHEGNGYNVVTLGTQVWMTKNIYVTTYRNGDAIPELTEDNSWTSTADPNDGGYCNYDNNEDGVKRNGRLYRWATATDSRGVLPEGYRIPSYEEIRDLKNFLGSNSGGQMKAVSNYWQSPNTGATNSSGLEFYPGGSRGDHVNGSLGIFMDKGTDSMFWGSSIAGYDSANAAYMSYDKDELFIGGYFNQAFGFSVRGMKDAN